MQTQDQPTVLEKPKTKIRHYPRWQVIGLNDDITPMEYVVLLLMEIFNKNKEDAFKLMMEVHETGAASFYIGNKEACELKVEQVQIMNKNYNESLQVRMEPMEE